MTTTPFADPEQMRRVKAQMLLDQLRAAGISPEELVALGATGTLPGQVRFRDYLAQVRTSAPAGSAHVYATYWDLMADGLPGFCACFCADCLAVFHQRDENGKPFPCPCRATGHCGCTKTHFKHPDTQSCEASYEGIGDKALAGVTRLDIEVARRWARTRAQKRWATRNANRAAKGRALFDHQGKSAEEHVRNAASYVFERAMEDPSTGVQRNVALQTDPVRRPKTTSRAPTLGQLTELWDAIFTSGGSDPELDMLIFWFHLETGARRGGALALTLGGLDLVGQNAKLVEKFDEVEWQPMSAELQRSLIGHALERGQVVTWAVDGLDPEDVTVDDVIAERARLRPDAAALYYWPKERPGPNGTVVRVPHALTRRRYNTLWDRLCRYLPWADQLHARPHDLRKLGGEFIERACGYAIAKAWLRHSDGDATAVYTKAKREEVAGAFERLTGRTHPLAEEARRRTADD